MSEAGNATFCTADMMALMSAGNDGPQCNFSFIDLCPTYLTRYIDIITETQVLRAHWLFKSGSQTEGI